MDQNAGELELYNEHAGTVKIAGATQPKGAGWCAFCFLRQGVSPIDFMCIGANANQQATKAMGIFRTNVLRSEQHKEMDLAFQPLLFRTHTEDAQSHEKKDKSVTVWRTMIVERKI
jgi:hypothetical protein